MIAGTREDIIKIKKTYPCFSQTKIAEEVGKTRQWVSHVLNQEGLIFKKERPCLNCGKDRGHNKLFCCRQCFADYHRVELTCEVCGGKFNRTISEVLHYDEHHQRDHIYCSRECFGKWLGENYGKGRKSKKEE